MKNSTFAILPSVSLALAVMPTVAGAMAEKPSAGAVIATTGGVFGVNERPFIQTLQIRIGAVQRHVPVLFGPSVIVFEDQPVPRR